MAARTDNQPQYVALLITTADLSPKLEMFPFTLDPVYFVNSEDGRVASPVKKFVR